MATTTSKPHKQARRLKLLALLPIFAACISVNIKPTASSRSKDYSYRDPVRPFQKVDHPEADVAWQAADSGHTIAVLTECSESRDPSLTGLEGETVQALNRYQVLRSDRFHFQGREALRSSVQGELDGVPVSIDLVVFKKNSCSYTLTYMGRTQGFETHVPVFNEFLKGFQAP